METSYTRMEKSIGLFVIGITVMLMTTVVMLGRGKDWFAEEVTFFTSFKESYNLQVNASVKLFKADIGKVKKISLEKDKVKVQLAILAKYAPRIRQDALAVVDSPTLIGSEYISIVPGAPDAPKIPDGGMIPSIEKKSMSDIFKEFEVEKTALLAVQAIQNLADLIAHLKDPHGPVMRTLAEFEESATHLSRITAEIAQGQGTLGSLVVSRELVDGVLLNLEKVSGMLDAFQLTAARGPDLMDRVDDNLTTIQTAGAGVVENVQILKEILKETEGAVESIRIILEHLKKGSKDIPRITVSAKDGIREIRDGVQNIDRVVQSLQRNIIIRANLPDEPMSMSTDAGTRP